MRCSQNRIITTHVGSLSRPAELLALNKTRTDRASDVAAYAAALTAAVADVVNKQRDIGIDIPNDGEFGKPMSAAYDYGAWWNYAFERLDRFAAPESIPESEHKRSTVAELSLTSFARRRDWQTFNEFYQELDERAYWKRASAPYSAASLHRADPIQGPSADASRHRKPEKSHGRTRHRGGLHDFGRASKLRSRRGPPLQQ